MTFLLNLLQSLLYGFVMGLTSWLPISSAAHMTLMKSFLPLRVFEDYLSNMAFWSLFRSVIQLGGLAAVLLLYWNRLNPYQKGLREQRKRKITRLWLMILISCVPAGLVGILLDDIIMTTLSKGYALAAGLILFGAFMVFAELKETPVTAETVNQIRPADSAKISLFRFLSLIPGIGHSASTIIGGKLIGFSRETAAEYSFFLAVPTIAGAFIMRVIKYILANAMFSFSAFGILLAGLVVCFVTSLFVMRYLLRYIRRNDLKVFGIYRIALGILVLVFTLFKVIS